MFFEGEHMFTVCAKAHQADIGNSIPSTYHLAAKDVYQEGALIFPCIRVQRNYETIDDIIRMCRTRIRVPEQWHGDFLAALGSARTGERRLKEFLCEIREADNHRVHQHVAGLLRTTNNPLDQEVAESSVGQ